MVLLKLEEFKSERTFINFLLFEKHFNFNCIASSVQYIIQLCQKSVQKEDTLRSKLKIQLNKLNCNTLAVVFSYFASQYLSQYRRPFHQFVPHMFLFINIHFIWHLQSKCNISLNNSNWWVPSSKWPFDHFNFNFISNNMK